MLEAFFSTTAPSLAAIKAEQSPGATAAAVAFFDVAIASSFVAHQIASLPLLIWLAAVPLLLVARHAGSRKVEC